MILKGDTVRFEVEYLDFDGNVMNILPEEVTFKVYAYPEKEVFSVALDHLSTHKLSDNHFYYNYTIPNDYEGTYFYEFNALYRYNPFIVREDFEVEFE